MNINKTFGFTKSAAVAFLLFASGMLAQEIVLAQGIASSASGAMAFPCLVALSYFYLVFLEQPANSFTFKYAQSSQPCAHPVGAMPC